MGESTFLTIVNKIAPSFDSLEQEIMEIKKDNKSSNKSELADIFANRIRRKYTSIGVASALPSIIPGVGTAVQVGFEVGAISGDALLLLRWMAAISYGIALIYGKNIRDEFNQEFVKVLGVWCGVIRIAKQATKRIGTRVAVVQFNKRVSGKVLAKINQKVGTTIFTKYGTKRGGIALGKLIPFGVGAIVAGTFNYVTMTQFKKAAIKYYSGSNFVIDEE